MSDPTTSLRRWRDAGLLSDEQVSAIVAYERDRVAAAGPSDATVPARASARRTTAVEAIGYVGGALAVGAVALLLGEVWDQLVAGARLAVLVLVTLLLGGAGLALRRATQPAMQRLASTLLAAAVGGVAWSVAVLAGDVATWSTRATLLAASLAALVAAVGCYLVARRPLVQVALLGAVVATAVASLAQPALTPDAVWYGLVLWAVGLAWLLVGRGGWLTPPRIAEVLGALVALVGLQATAWGDHRAAVLGLAVLTAAGLIGLAIAVEGVHHLVVGAVGLFVLVPQLVFELFGDAIGAPATLLVVGLLLVLVAVGLGRARREVRDTAGEEVPA